MARLKIHIDRIIENVNITSDFMELHDKQWSLVVKALGNNKEVLSHILLNPAIKRTHSVATSQWNNLKMIKDINPELKTMFIKPPSMKNAERIVRYADVSLNSSFATIKALNDAAHKLGTMHQIIVMIEMGELREGIKREGLIAFYKSVFKLSNIDVVGIGTNLGCMHGIKPTYDKLIQLVLYEQLIEAKFKRNLELVSGASSITLPLLEKDKIPQGMNHFRIGEAVFLGTSPLNNKPFLNLNTGAFTFEANIVELYRKESTPDGIISDAAIGHSVTSDHDGGVHDSFRAVVDFGLLDVDADYLIPEDETITFSGNSSDLTVYDMGENPHNYKSGDVLRFRLKYIALAKLMYSQYVEKVIVS
jgi:predicted amino acid racemase